MKEIVIFGAGEWGKLAYHYYKNVGKIVYYIDNDKTIWGTRVNDITVQSPAILKEGNYTVVIANKRYENDIKNQLLNEYNIKAVILFRISETMQELYDKNIEHAGNTELIVAFSHGLGNQMFQYALYRNYIAQGKQPKADLSAYIKPNMRPFELTKVFPNLKLEFCEPWDKAIYMDGESENIYIEQPPCGEVKRTYKADLLNKEYGYVEGFHCSYKYPELIRAELLEDFVFLYHCDKTLCELKEFFESRNIVGVHVRLGDFLKPENRREMGDICTRDYYKRAIDIIKTKHSDAIFFFFSDDMEWVKYNLKVDNAIYMDSTMFQKYQDWYDMYLMSICKHNIIPNSTFGWWGAWLNQNTNKIVIAPKKWRNRWEAEDWCPSEWILI